MEVDIVGLTYQSTGQSVLNDSLSFSQDIIHENLIALAGNPNTGKSTVFNALTGLKQHTGNWPGKTITHAKGYYNYDNQKYQIIDLPGTYSLLANSIEEEVSRDFICFNRPKVTVIVTDATCLERNLNLVLQILEMTNQVVLCINLMDEAKRKGITVDIDKLSKMLNIPVIATNARDNIGLDDLKKAVTNIINKPNLVKENIITYDEKIESILLNVQSELDKINQPIPARWLALRLLDNSEGIYNNLNKYYNMDLENFPDLLQTISTCQEQLINHYNSKNNLKDNIVSSIVKTAENLHKKVVTYTRNNHNAIDRRLDSVLTSKTFGIPIMLILLGIIFWLTITGANYPSALIAEGLFYIEEKLHLFFIYINAPNWLHGIFVSGMYRTLAWVVSVMLPPMAIFFPMFTLLEDLGYLPRIAFNLDCFFKKACAHGKQALTMCMGFGCNAAGIIGCRIIDSERERLIAIITNNFVPCNGRFPTLIALSCIFIAGLSTPFSSIKATLAILIAIILSVFITLIISKILSKTVLKGIPSTFTLELPPYRKPQVVKIIVRSIYDRTLFVLLRAIAVAAPAGIVLWLLANIFINDISILAHMSNFLDPFAQYLGLDGYILSAFIIGLPANEIVIPIIIMGYLSKGALLELDSLTTLRDLFIQNGWTPLTAICTMLFSLNHFPCGTTLLTIHKETKSIKWTFLSFLIPTIIGILLCFIVAQSAFLFGIK